ncbi:MAG: hypothetical protein J6W81_00235 [Lentisphaeria bacterium]|nr:hypothetical protein [Lentisphaeria bacterium]
MKLTPEILKALQEAINYYGNTSQFAKQVGIAHSTVLFWLSGKTSNISGHIWSSRVRKELHRFMNPPAEPRSTVQSSEIREEPSTFLKVATREDLKVPVTNFSQLINFDSTMESPVTFSIRKLEGYAFFGNEPDNNSFAVMLDTEDAYPALPPWTRLLISGGEYAKDGDVVLCKLRNPLGVYLCRYTRDDENISLYPLNPALKSMSWSSLENADKVAWMYPVEEISIDLAANRWEDRKNTTVNS